MKRLALRLTVAALLACAGTGALAHRFHTGITDLSHNARTDSVEVVHTLMAHDIDALLAMRGRRPVDVAEADGEALLRAYMDEHFYLLGADGKRLPLKWIGLRAGVESVIVFQELERSSLASVARVHNDILADFLPNQSNTVNIRTGSEIRSQSFTHKNSDQALK